VWQNKQEVQSPHSSIVHVQTVCRAHQDKCGWKGASTQLCSNNSDSQSHAVQQLQAAKFKQQIPATPATAIALICCKHGALVAATQHIGSSRVQLTPYTREEGLYGVPVHRRQRATNTH
jgi:hypothetical protein